MYYIMYIDFGTPALYMYVQDCHRLSWDVPGYHMYLYIIFCVVFVVSPASSPSKGVELHRAFSSTPFTDGEGLWLLLKTGLTSCQIGGIGYPRTAHGNPIHIPDNNVQLLTVNSAVLDDSLTRYTLCGCSYTLNVLLFLS